MIYIPISVPSFLILRIHDTYFWIYQDSDHDGVALGEGGQGSCPPLPLVSQSPGTEPRLLNPYPCLGASVTLLCTGDGGRSPGCFSSPEYTLCSPGHGLCLPVLARLSQGLCDSLPPSCSPSNCSPCPVLLPFACRCPLTRAAFPPAPFTHSFTRSLTCFPPKTLKPIKGLGDLSCLVGEI